MRLLTLTTVLVATDLEDQSLPALRAAHELANAAGATLHVAYSSASSNAIEKVYATAQKVGLSLDDVSIHPVGDDTSGRVNQLADRLGANVVVLGPHRARPDATSTALSLITKVSVPCLVVPSALCLPLRRVVVAIDCSDPARGALVIGLSWASALRARSVGHEPPTALTVLHVSATASGPEVTRVLDDEVKRVRQEAGNWAGIAIASVSTSNADAATGIASYANEQHADLVVLGTRGLGMDNVSRLGSVSFAVMQQLRMPTLLVPPAIWMAYASQSSPDAAA